MTTIHNAVFREFVSLESRERDIGAGKSPSFARGGHDEEDASYSSTHNRQTQR